MKAIILAACLALAACGGSPGGKKKSDIPDAAGASPNAPAVIIPTQTPQPAVELPDGEGPLWPWAVVLVLISGGLLLHYRDGDGR